jgi:hypothetical protein
MNLNNVMGTHARVIYIFISLHPLLIEYEETRKIINAR